MESGNNIVSAQEDIDIIMGIEGVNSSGEEFKPSKRNILPSVDDKINQSVNFGSVFLALAEEFFTPEELMNWLGTSEVTELTKIAYKALCHKISPNEQYFESGYHFLVSKPDYAPIAIGFGLDLGIPENKEDISSDFLEDNPIEISTCEVLAEFINKASARKFYNLLLAGKGPAEYIRSNLLTCYKARNFPHLHITAHEINVALVEADWIGRFRYNEGLAKLILRRVVRLQEIPIYYAGVACKAYRDVVVKLNKEKLFTQLTRDELATLDSFFPDIIDRKILEYDELAYKISLLGNDVAGYVLGFPVQNMIPNEEQIHTAIRYLTEHGIEEYARYISEYIEKSYFPIAPFPVNNHTYPNDQDVMMEDLNNYVPFDVISYRSGDYIYRFTRAEFSHLVKTKKNPWTKEWLPPTILSTIKARGEAAKELGLPPARSLIDMLKRVETGTLFEPDEEPTTSSPEAVRPILNDPVSLFTSLLGHWSPGLPQNPPIENVHFQMNAGNQGLGITPVSYNFPYFGGRGYLDIPSIEIDLSEIEETEEEEESSMEEVD